MHIVKGSINGSCGDAAANDDDDCKKIRAFSKDQQQRGNLKIEKQEQGLCFHRPGLREGECNFWWREEAKSSQELGDGDWDLDDIYTKSWSPQRPPNVGLKQISIISMRTESGLGFWVSAPYADSLLRLLAESDTELLSENHALTSGHTWVPVPTCSC